MNTKVLLYSGGMDSWLVRQLWKPDVLLYVNMDTEYSQQEMSKLPDDCKVVTLPLGQWERADGIIPCRNLILATIASNYGEVIALGATRDDLVFDKTSFFAYQASQMLTYLNSPQHWTAGREIEVTLPYKHLSKSELLKQYVDVCNGDLHTAFSSTFSCYFPTPEGSECWECKACFRKWIAFANNGLFHICKAPSAIAGTWESHIKLGAFNRSPAEAAEIISAMSQWRKRQ